MPPAPKTLALIVLDGWGHRAEGRWNAIAAARKPTWDRLWGQYPHTLLHASENAVGLPARQMGNSEVGHLNLGAGRVVYQEITRIDRAIASGAFFTNAPLTAAVDAAVAGGGTVHLLGLLSPGGVHSHERHLHAMAELAARRGARRVILHAFLDGRDRPPRSAGASLTLMEEKFRELGLGRIASLIGRYYAMDRDHRWPRVQAAYELLTEGKAVCVAETAAAGLEAAYARGESDEFVAATVVQPAGETPAVIRDGDVVVFMNFRSDRARQLARAFHDPDFDGFARARHPKLAAFVTLTDYQAGGTTPAAFPPEALNNGLGEYLARLGRRQLRVAETEKYAHVTFFFNGGRERPFAGEDRVLVPSPTDVATYNLKPEMSARAVTAAVVEAVRCGRHDVILCNFANADMVGHTGDLQATVQAIEAIDACLAEIERALRAAGGEMIVTADHGNAEQMYDPDSGQAHTAHTTNPVPFIYVGRPARVAAGGALEDIAPTLLRLLDLPIPAEMTGHPLVEILSAPDARNTAAAV